MFSNLEPAQVGERCLDFTAGAHFMGCLAGEDVLPGADAPGFTLYACFAGSGAVLRNEKQLPGRFPSFQIPMSLGSFSQWILLVYSQA